MRPGLAATSIKAANPLFRRALLSKEKEFKGIKNDFTSVNGSSEVEVVLDFFKFLWDERKC